MGWRDCPGVGYGPSCCRPLPDTSGCQSRCWGLRPPRVVPVRPERDAPARRMACGGLWRLRGVRLRSDPRRGAGASSRRVRQMLAHGTLPGQRVGRTWVVDRADLQPLQHQRPPVGRPWEPASAWALLAMASGRAAGLSASQRSRARGRLDIGLEHFLERLVVRAEPRRCYAHPSVSCQPVCLGRALGAAQCCVAGGRRRALAFRPG